MRKSQMLYRTKLFDRVCHAIVVICFLLVALSGLGMFFPSLHFLTYVLGTPQLARVLHPILGCVIVFAFAIMFFRFAKHNTFNKNDVKWFKEAKNITLGHHNKDIGGEEHLPIGKYNAGQKMLFWGIMLFMLTLFASGIVIWNHYFSGVFPIPVVRFALLIHSMAAVAFIIWIIGHAYMAIWVKGTIASMIVGYVPKLWAKKHHPLWYKEMTEKEHKAEDIK